MPAESIEIVDEITAHKGLDCPINVTQVDALLQNLVTIHINEFLRNTRQESRIDATNFGTFACSLKKRVDVFRKELNIAAGTIFEQKRESPGCADPRNRRRRKPEYNRLGYSAEFTIQIGFQGLKLFCARRAIVPRPEGNEEGRVIRGTHEAQ